MERKKKTVNKWKKLLQLSLLCLGLMGFTFGVRAADAGVYLMEAEGSVSIKTGSGRSLQRSEGEKLDSGNRILTKEDGRAKLGVGDGGELILEAGGVLEYRSMGSRREFLLENGILFFDWKKEAGAFSIRTSTTAFTAYHAKGWVRIVDRYHTLLCLEEGELSCSVTDPVSGQVKSASLMEKNVAECVVYPKEENGERCDILLRELAEEEREEAIQTAKAAGKALGQELSHINDINNAEKAETQPEESQTAELRDPVWGGEVELADASSNEEGAETLEDEDDPLDAGNVVRYFPGIVLPPSMPYTPLSGGIFKEEMQVADSDSGHSSEPASNPSASAPPAGSEPSSSENPSDSVGPTKNRGLIAGEGFENNGTILIENGSMTAPCFYSRNYGKIQIEKDGRLSLKDSEGEIQHLGNLNSYEEGKGIIINKGVMEADIWNYHTASFTMESGSVTKVQNLMSTEGTIRISGGIVEEGVWVADGSFEMTGGTVKALKGEDTIAVDIWNYNHYNTTTNVKITGGTILNENGGPAIRLRGGKLELSDSVVVKAKEPLKLVTVEGVNLRESPEISYVSGGKVYTEVISDEDNLNLAALYVTKQGTDGLTTLSSLGERFSEAVEVINAGKGDRITLGQNVSETDLDTIIEAKGGTTGAPVVLDLNRKHLEIKNVGSTIKFSKAAWKIENGSLSISEYINEKSAGSGLMLIDEQSNISLSGITMNHTGIENKGKCTISNVGAGEIVNSGTCTAKGEIKCQDVTNDGGIFKIQNADVIMSEGGIQNAVSDKESSFSISDSELQVCDINNAINGTCEISSCRIGGSGYTVRIGNAGEFFVSNGTFWGESCEIDNVGRFSMTNSAMNPDAGSITNNGEFLASKSTITLSDTLLNSGSRHDKNPVCRLTDCTVSIGDGTDSKILNENANLFIKGGSVSSKRGGVIQFGRNTQEQEQKIEIEGVDFSASRVGNVILIDCYPLSDLGCPGSRSIIIRDTDINGGDAPAIRATNGSNLGKMKLIVEKEAYISSESPSGTIFIDVSTTSVPTYSDLKVYLNGGSIVNESKQSGTREETSNYAAINIYGLKKKDSDQQFMVEGTGTQVKVNGDREPLVYFEYDTSTGSKKLCSKVEGYTTEQNEDGYTYLVSGTDKVFLSALPDQTENEPLEQPSAELPDDEASKPEISVEGEEDQEEQKKEEDKEKEKDQEEGKEQEKEEQQEEEKQEGQEDQKEIIEPPKDSTELPENENSEDDKEPEKKTRPEGEDALLPSEKEDMSEERDGSSLEPDEVQGDL